MLGFLKTTTYEEELRKSQQPVKLSDLILQGCKLAPKAEREYANDWGTCALGAAYHAKSGEKEGDGFVVLEGLGLLDSRNDMRGVARWVVFCNDTLRMPREIIAYTLKLSGK